MASIGLNRRAHLLYPIPRASRVFPLWALGKMLILFGMLKPYDRRVVFLRLQTLLQTSGVDTRLRVK